MSADPTQDVGPGREEALRELEAHVRELAAFERPSASEGERRAAELIARRLRALGLRDVRVEAEPAHGGFWVPLGTLSAVAGLAGLVPVRGRAARALRSLAAALCALGVWDEIGLHRGVWTRRLLRTRTTYNVAGEAGDPAAPRAVVVIAHHDAAHSGAIFDPTLPHALGRRFPGVIERARAWPRVMRLVLAGPALVALAAGERTAVRRARHAAALLSLGSAAAFADIAARGVVAGANDNLTGVATVIGVARALAERPVDGLRVVLLSAGSEESFEEGSQAFLRRHAADLPPHRTAVIAVDSVGSPHLVLVEGEGMLRRLAYDPRLKDVIAAAAQEARIPIIREHWLSFGSDALAGLQAGHASALVASFDDVKLPANYHWPTDVPENVDFTTVYDAVRVVEGAVRRLAR